MGSVSDNVDCPKCKSPDCYIELWYKTGEEFISCPKCGYKYVFLWKCDENGDYILKDPAKGISPDNMIPEITEENNNYAAYTIINSSGSVSGHLTDFEEYEKFQKYIEEVKPESNITKVVVNRFVDGKFISEEL